MFKALPWTAPSTVPCRGPYAGLVVKKAVSKKDDAAILLKKLRALEEAWLEEAQQLDGSHPKLTVEEEFGDLLIHRDITSVIHTFDPKKSGQVLKKDFSVRVNALYNDRDPDAEGATLMSNLGLTSNREAGLPKEDLDKIFDKFDDDHGGSLQPWEVRNILKQMRALAVKARKDKVPVYRDMVSRASRLREHAALAKDAGEAVRSAEQAEMANQEMMVTMAQDFELRLSSMLAKRNVALAEMAAKFGKFKVETNEYTMKKPHFQKLVKSLGIDVDASVVDAYFDRKDDDSSGDLDSSEVESILHELRAHGVTMNKEKEVKARASRRARKRSETKTEAVFALPEVRPATSLNQPTSPKTSSVFPKSAAGFGPVIIGGAFETRVSTDNVSRADMLRLGERLSSSNGKPPLPPKALPPPRPEDAEADGWALGDMAMTLGKLEC